MERTIALFGEAERGRFNTAYCVQSLDHLVDYLGNPPEDTRGLHYAVQALLLEWNLIFFRVREEGFSEEDYFRGLSILKNKQLVPQLAAVCMPGMGSEEVLSAVAPLSQMHHTLIITSEPDFYDYLTYSTRNISQ